MTLLLQHLQSKEGEIFDVQQQGQGCGEKSHRSHSRSCCSSEGFSNRFCLATLVRRSIQPAEASRSPTLAPIPDIGLSVRPLVSCTAAFLMAFRSCQQVTRCCLQKPLQVKARLEHSTRTFVPSELRFD
jgi:hypothetical protein